MTGSGAVNSTWTRTCTAPRSKKPSLQGSIAWLLGNGETRTSTSCRRAKPGFWSNTGWRGRAELIKSAAETLFGVGARPRAIVLTHVHPDHAGSASELAHMWDVTVYVLPDELPLPPSGRIIGALVLPVIRYEHDGVIPGEHAESGIPGAGWVACVHAGGGMLMLSPGPSPWRPWRSPGVPRPVLAGDAGMRMPGSGENDHPPGAGMRACPRPRAPRSGQVRSGA